MTSVYHIFTIHVNETSWAHVWRLHFCYLGTGYDTLLVPLSTTSDALLGAVGGDVGRHLHIAAWGHFLASRGRTQNDHLMASGAPGGDVAWLL
jgi:hypothetical protein